MKSLILTLFVIVSFNSTAFADVSILACKAIKIQNERVFSKEDFSLNGYSNVDITIDSSDQARVWIGKAFYELGNGAYEKVEASIRQIKYLIDTEDGYTLLTITKNLVDETGKLYVQNRVGNDLGNNFETPRLVAELECHYDSSVISN